MLITCQNLRLSRLSNALPKAERGTAMSKIDFSGPRCSSSILAPLHSFRWEELASCSLGGNGSTAMEYR